MEAIDRLIIPLDLPTVAQAAVMVEDIGKEANFYKIGHQLAFAGGIAFAKELLQDGKKVFLDMKLLDIDNTISKGVENIVRMGVQMTTIHAYPKAMKAAVDAAKGSDLCLLGVTVLTSMDDEDLADAGYSMDAESLVLRRAAKASELGMGGIVASAKEASQIKELVSPEMSIVTPGIRPAGSAVGDQKRVMTPGEAISSGATHLVVGRPITGSSDPAAAARSIVEEIEAASPPSLY